MKKFTLSILFVTLGILSMYASFDLELPSIDLKCYNKRPSDGLSQLLPRTPITVPVVYQDNYNLIFETPGFCQSITLIDINTDDIMYESIVTESTTQISLPASLDGEYEIRFNSEKYYYSGILEF